MGSDPSSPQDSAPPSPEPTYGKTPAPTNPTATVGLPLAGSVLALRSDGAFSNGVDSFCRRTRATDRRTPPEASS